MKRKYGGSFAEVIAFGEQAAERMRKIEGRDAELERLAEEIEQARAKLEKRAQRCGKLRTAAAPKLAENVAQKFSGPRLSASGIRSATHADTRSQN